MSTLTEIEAAVDSLAPTEQRALLHFLATRLQGSPSSRPKHSVLDIPTVSLGKTLRPLAGNEYDLLGEMLEGRV